MENNNNTDNQPLAQPIQAQPVQAAPAPAPAPTPTPAPAVTSQSAPAQPQPVYQPVYQQVPPQNAGQQPYQQIPPQYAAQQPYQQVPPQYAAQPAAPQYTAQPYASNQKMSELDMMSPEERSARTKKANLLCFISLGLHFLPEILSGALGAIIREIGNASDMGNASDFFTSALSFLLGGSYIAAWVLMIIARVKYKESVFAKVLMWIYIGILALGILAVILFIAMCAYILKDCHGF